MIHFIIFTLEEGNWTSNPRHVAEVCANNNFEDELWEVIDPCAHLGLAVGDNLAIYKEMQVKTQQLDPLLTKGIFNLK